MKNRRSRRLKGYSYSENGGYFVTICTKEKEPYFVIYPELKNIIVTEWQSLAERFPTMVADTFVVMPNHIHGIIVLNNVGATQNNVGATLAVAQRAGASPAPTIGNIIGSYKSLCVIKWLKYIKRNNINTVGAIWQRNYYEHIIRNEQELNQIREYIVFNPLKWSFDVDNPDHLYDQEYLQKWQWVEGEGG